MTSNTPKLIIISGPSGAGKSKIVGELMNADPVPMIWSVSATTRDPRTGEVDGKDYHFLSHDEFARRRENDEFLEYKEVFKQGQWYGTLRSEVSSGLESGKWVLLEIDVEGAISILDQMDEVETFFVHPGSLEILEQRLRDRGTNTEEDIQRRLATARHEMSLLDRYKHEIINDDLQRAVGEICDLLQRSGD